MKRASKTDGEIRGAILAAYRDHEARGMAAPKQAELWAACNSTSGRVSRHHQAMRLAGELPDLPTSQAQRGGMAAVKGHRNVAERRAKPGPAKVRRERSEHEQMVADHLKRERYIRWLARQARAEIERRERAAAAS